jgi:hypothetical protein
VPGIGLNAHKAGETMPLVYSRPKKLNHVDTVRYEIYMLRFSIQRLTEEKVTERDAWAYLEVFLTHYRSLIDFLGLKNPSSNDLHVISIWQLANLAPPATISEIHAKGEILRARYEPTDARGGGRISQYLHHCTTKRIDHKDWEVGRMYNEIEPLLTEVETHFGPHTEIMEPVQPVKIPDAFSASTTIGTHTAVSAVVVGRDPKR